MSDNSTSSTSTSTSSSSSDASTSSSFVLTSSTPVLSTTQDSSSTSTIESSTTTSVSVALTPSSTQNVVSSSSSQSTAVSTSPTLPSSTSTTSLFSLSTSSTTDPNSTVTQVVTGSPSSTDVPSPSNSFFDNKGAVAGTFTVVALVIVALGAVLLLALKRRQRRKRLEMETELAVAQATTHRGEDFYSDEDAFDDGYSTTPYTESTLPGGVDNRGVYLSTSTSPYHGEEYGMAQRHTHATSYDGKGDFDQYGVPQPHTGGYDYPPRSPPAPQLQLLPRPNSQTYNELLDAAGVRTVSPTFSVGGRPTSGGRPQSESYASHYASAPGAKYTRPETTRGTATPPMSVVGEVHDSSSQDNSIDEGPRILKVANE